jgi:acyl carrier protein
MLANMWAEVLKVEQVGVDDNFFELGGHSVLMVQLQAKLRKALKREISIIELFKYSTISTLAAHLGREEADGGESGPSDERVEARKTSRKRRRALRQSAR